MRAAGEPAQHRCSLNCIARLTERVAVDVDDGISCNHDSPRILRKGRPFKFFTRVTACDFNRSDARQFRLVVIANHHLDFQAERA